MQGHALLHRPLSSTCQVTDLTSYNQALKPAYHRLKRGCHPRSETRQSWAQDMISSQNAMQLIHPL